MQVAHLRHGIHHIGHLLVSLDVANFVFDEDRELAPCVEGYIRALMPLAENRVVFRQRGGSATPAQECIGEQRSLLVFGVRVEKPSKHSGMSQLCKLQTEHSQ